MTRIASLLYNSLTTKRNPTFVGLLYSRNMRLICQQYRKLLQVVKTIPLPWRSPLYNPHHHLVFPAMVSRSTVVRISGRRLLFIPSAICSMPFSTPCPVCASASSETFFITFPAMFHKYFRGFYNFIISVLIPALL